MTFQIGSDDGRMLWLYRRRLIDRLRPG